MSHARILLVEDDPSVAQLVERCLGNSGYAICAVVPSGEEAIREVARLQPDLVLMDVALSGAVDGIEAARRVRDEHRTPVVFLTGLGDETTLERVQAAGAFGYLLKPFRPEEVRTSIEIALQRHRSVSALQRIEHWFSATIRAISDAVITTNESGTITFVNPVAAGLAGWAVNDAIGRSLGEVFHITDATGRSVVEDLLRPVLTEGRPIRLFGALTLHTRRQTTVPVEAEAAPIRNDQGQSIGVALVYRDLTERQRAEAALRESEERFHIFMENSPVVAFIKDDRGRYLFGNPAWARQFGRPAGELIGQADVQLWPPATAETFRRSDEAAFASGQPIETVESGQRPDGSPYHALVYKFVFQNAAGQRLLGGLALDITSRKEAEAEISRSREQLRLLAAHLQSIREEERTRIAREIHDELGQMLTGLKMDLAWMERRLAAGSLADSQAVLVDKCRSMADLLDRMVKSVRKIAAELRPGVLDDLGLVPALEWQAREFQTRTGVECHLETRLGVTEIPRDLGTAVFRIFQESLTNVARHAQASRVQASLVADGHALHLVVHDNGRGITDAQQANAKSFGLLGMRERAATLGGECHIAGQPGAGTTITVRIPLPPPAPTS